MHQQLVVVLLVGLAASVYGLDLSHAAKRSTEVDPRVFGFLNDFYNQVVYPPLNHVVQNMALLGAQVLASVALNGIPGPAGRTLHPTEAELRGFWDDFWNNAIKPPIENALSGVALLGAQVLAGVGLNGVNLGIGKRDLSEAEMRGFLDDLAASLNQVFTQVIQKPLENAVAGSALMLAQLLAGIGTNGINLSIGKRDLTEAEMRGFLDDLTASLNQVFTQVIQKPLENAVAGSALMLAQLLAGIGTNGIDLSGILGKRDSGDLAGREAELRGIFTNLGSNILNGLQSTWNNVFQNPLENFIQTGALSLAQTLANLGVNGVNLGKRSAEARGPIIDDLVSHATGLFQTQVKPTLENALNAAAIHLAGILANVSQTLGRR
jgi:hypothetical protein